MELIIFLSLIVVGYVSGRLIESRHYRSIEAREQESLSLPVVNIKHALDPRRDVARVRLVAGNAVISVDHFKRFLAGLRNVFGGRVSSYESLIDRARREAVLRMKAEAAGADIILNMRIETSSISKGRKKSVGSIEAFAYGTAVTYAPGPARKPQPAQRQAAPQPVVQPTPTEPTSSPSARYRVVFTGEIAPGHDPDTVKRGVAALYKVPVERCEHLFNGNVVTIKDQLDRQTAQKYKNAFERTGAVCRIEPRQA